MAESIIDLLRPGFPKYENDGKSFRTFLEYVGKEDRLSAIVVAGLHALPGYTWGTYPGRIVSSRPEPLEGREDYWQLQIVCEYLLQNADYQAGHGEDKGVLEATVEEIDWIKVQRPIYEHPEFLTGGRFELSFEDIIHIEVWKLMPDPQYKKDFQYVEDGDTEKWRISGGGSDGLATLSDNAIACAKGILKKIEYYEDTAPVARRTETYVNGPGPKNKAGKKETPPNFDNLPAGYEWIRETDRSVRRGANNRWDRDLEWIGAKKVLIDCEKLYYL